MGDNADVVLRIDGNSLGSQAAVDSLISRLKELGIQAKVSGKETSDSHQAAATSALKLGDALKEAYENPKASLRSLVEGVDKDLVGALGTVAAAGAVVGAVVVGALAESAIHAVELGEQLQDVAYKLSTTATNAAALKYVFDVAGGSIEQAGNLLFMMQRQMENSPDTFEKGLKNIGLNIQELQGLDPVDMFLKVADAFRENTNQANRAGTAVDLFTRQGRDAVSLLMKPLSELNEEFKKNNTYTNQDAHDAEELGMAWRKFKENTEWMATDVGVKVLHFMGAVFGASTDIRYSTRSDGSINVTDDLGMPGALDALKKLGGPKLGAADPTPLSISQEKAKLYIDETNEALERQRIALEKAEVAAIAYAHSAPGNAERSEAILAALTDPKSQFTHQFDYLAGQDIILPHTQSPSFYGALPSSDILGSTFGSTVNPYSNDGLPNVSPSMNIPAILNQKTLGDRLAAQAPAAILAALQGGGSVSGTLGGLFGGELGKDLGKDASDAIGGKLGTVLGSAIPGLGTILGGLGGSLIGKGIGALMNIGGPSKEELQSRSDRDSFMASYKSAGDVTGIQTLADALQKTGMSAENARVHIAAMLDAKNPQAFQAALAPVMAQLGMGTDATNALNDALTRYKFTTEQLGPALERQNLDAQAQQLYKDWTVLNAAQVDTVSIGKQMSENVSQFLQDSIRTGTEVPIAMKPMLEQMARMGDLTDAAGNTITDLSTSGVTFSETMTQGFKDVVASVKDLANAIRASLGLALNDVTSAANTAAGAINNLNGLDVQPGWTETGMGNPGEGPPSFATEAYVRYPTLAHLGDVAGGEFVLKPSTIARYMNAATRAGADVAAGGGTHLHAPIDARGSFFPDRESLRDLAEMLHEPLDRVLTQNYMNKGGAMALQRG